MKKLLAFGLLSVMMLSMVALPVMAQTNPGQFPTDVGIDPVSGYDTVGGVVGVFLKIIQWLYTILFVVAVFFIILAAYNFVTSSGDETKTGTAKKQLLYAVIGIAVGLLAFAIVRLVQSSVTTGFGG